MNFYPAILNMEWQLANIPVPSRFTSSLSLSECFMRQDEKIKRKKQAEKSKKQKSKKAVQAKGKGKEKEKTKTADKGKGKGKAKSKKIVRSDDSEDDEEYENIDIDDDDDDDDDDDEEALSDGIDESAEMIVNLNEQDPSKKALIEEHVSMISLLTLSIKSVRSKTLKVKGSRSMPMWGKPWRRSFEFDASDSDLSASKHRSHNIVLYHTLEWPSVSLHNEARMRREIAGAAIHEYCVILGYRPALLSAVRGGAATLRASLERAVYTSLIQGKGTPAPKGDRYQRLLTWPDAVKYDSLSVFKSDVRFHLGLEINNTEKRIKMATQKKSIQNVIRGLQNCDVACRPSTTNPLKKSTLVRPEVADMLEKLIEVRPVIVAILLTSLTPIYLSHAQTLNRSAYLDHTPHADSEEIFRDGIPDEESLTFDFKHKKILKSSSSQTTTKSSPKKSRSDAQSKNDKSDDLPDTDMPSLFPYTQEVQMIEKETQIRKIWWNTYDKRKFTGSQFCSRPRLLTYTSWLFR